VGRYEKDEGERKGGGKVWGGKRGRDSIVQRKRGIKVRVPLHSRNREPESLKTSHSKGRCGGGGGRKRKNDKLRGVLAPGNGSVEFKRRLLPWAIGLREKKELNQTGNRSKKLENWGGSGKYGVLAKFERRPKTQKNNDGIKNKRGQKTSSYT